MFAKEQMDRVDLFIDPNASLMLVEAHAPETEDVVLLVDIDISKILKFLLEVFQAFVRIALSDLSRKVQGVGFNALLEVFKRDAPVSTGFTALLSLFNFLTGHFRTALSDCFFLAQNDGVLFSLNILFFRECVFIGRTHAVADIHCAGCEDAVLVDEIVVDRVTVNNFSQDVVEDCQVTVRSEDDRFIGHVRTHVLIGREVDDLRFFVCQLTVGNTRPKNRMGFGHVVAPQDHCVALFDIGVVVCRFIDTEHLIETDHSARHAKTCVRVKVVGTPAGFYEFAGCVSFRNGVLAAAEDGDACRSFFLINTFELVCHFGEGFVPCHRFKLTVLIKFAVSAAHQRLCQTILTVEDLGIEIAFNAVQTSVYRCIGVALSCDNASVFDADLKTAACTAEAAYAFCPNDLTFAALNCGSSDFAQRDANRHRCGCSNTGFQ